MIISKNTKIFLIIFSAVLLLITIGAIVYKKTHNNSIGSQIIIESAQKIPNVSNEDVNGQIRYKIIMPNGKVDNFDLNRTESIKAKSELNEYDKYYIKEEYPIGRYFVDGTFWWNGMNVLSDTNKNDFFDVVEGE